MKTLHTSDCIRASASRTAAITTLVGVLALSSTTVHALDFTEDFDAALDPAIWSSTEAKTVTVAGGILTWEDDGGNWSSGDISTVESFFIPEAGDAPTTIEWTLAPCAITTDAGQSIRLQIGIHSTNETASRKEHWTNTSGGLWLDLDDIQNTNTAGVSGNLTAANDTKVQAENGQFVGSGEIADWNWQVDSKVITLELTDTGFTWYNAGVMMATGTYATFGIDTEFDNGYKVLALGMNFDTGRGTTAIDKIEVLNAPDPSSLITSIGASNLTPFGGQPFILDWVTDPSAILEIDQGIGNVDALTNVGEGQLGLVAPLVAVPTAVDYTLTATLGAEAVTRAIRVNVAPAPELELNDFSDSFDGADIDPANWEHRGGRAYTVNGSLVNWTAADGGDWGHGEVDSVKAFPLPPAGRTTEVIWTLGPAAETLDSGSGQAIRPMLGLVSAWETQTWSRQHWQNTNGGIWMDFLNMGAGRPDGVSGDFLFADDTKAINTNGTVLTGFDIPDWNWQTESHVFRVEVTDTGYSWYNGDTLLAMSTWAAAGLDDEFAGGFKILMMAGNFSTGRGEISLESIEVINGAASGGPLEIIALSYDEAASTIELTWNSKRDTTYAIDVSTDLIEWEEAEDSIPSDDIQATHTFIGTNPGIQFFRVREE